MWDLSKTGHDTAQQIRRDETEKTERQTDKVKEGGRQRKKDRWRDRTEREKGSDRYVQRQRGREM